MTAFYKTDQTLFARIRAGKDVFWGFFLESLTIITENKDGIVATHLTPLVDILILVVAILSSLRAPQREIE